MPASRTLLIIDDDDDLREALAEQLALHEEFVPRQAANATDLARPGDRGGGTKHGFEGRVDGAGASEPVVVTGLAVQLIEAPASVANEKFANLLCHQHR